MSIFVQNSFSGGMDTELDYVKTPQNAYPLLINGRGRKDVIEPTYKHLELAAPAGLKQGIYVAGSILVIFVAGVAYYTDITKSPIVFHPVVGWTNMSATASRIYAELIPTTGNYFNFKGNPQLMDKVFNNSMSTFPQAMLCFDGINQPQAIMTDGTATVMGKYETWTKDAPNYVPIGILPAMMNNKLFLASPDRRRILHSVSGRMTDFVINVDNDGNKGGNADTVSQVVAFNDITSLKPLASGQLMVNTLYASYVLNLDYNNPIFGEPFLFATELFPIGCLNELSVVDILQDTAFVTQSGIHSFNTVAQNKRESNNAPFGAKIRGLLKNPQANTCTALHDDYAYIAVNTIFGYGALVFDTNRKNFQSLDLSFGQVRQFANTRISGSERLFFITQDNKIYEAFGADDVNSTKVYLGEWASPEADTKIKASTFNVQFGSCLSSGQAKISIYADKAFIEDKVFDIINNSVEENFPIPLPYVSADQCNSISYPLKNQVRGWRLGAMFEWNFKGNLISISVDGTMEKAPNVDLVEQVEIANESFAFVADTGFGSNLNTGGNFLSAGIAIVDVTKGSYYVFDANTDGVLVNGTIEISSGLFRALSSQLVVKGTANEPKHFSLRNADNMVAVMNAISGFKPDGRNKWLPDGIVGGGDHSYENGALLDVTMGLLPFKLPLWSCAGDIEYGTNLATNFFNKLQIPRFYVKSTSFVDFIFYNGGWTPANVPVNSSGITTGATSEPNGNTEFSNQAGWARNAVSSSTKKFKILVVHEPPWTTDNTYYPGYADLRFLSGIGAHAILSGHGHVMERRIVNNFPFFVCGVGGKSLNSFKVGTEGLCNFRDNTNYGFLAIQADPLTCKLSFVNVAGEILDTYALYA